MKNTRKMVFMAILIALSVVLGIVDNTISGPIGVQGAKIGLANIIIILAIIYFSPGETFFMVLLKSMLVSLIANGFSTFLLTFTGTMLSFISMYLLIKVLKKKSSLYFVSIVGGVMHAVGQLVAAGWFYKFGLSVLGYAPQLLLLSILTGYITGRLAQNVLSYVDRTRVFEI